MSMRLVRQAVRRMPVVGPWLVLARRAWSVRNFSDSGSYWEQRYRSGGSSGAGSYGRLARFKAEVINGIVSEFDVHSAIEFGCGDGNQLVLLNYPRYTGFDVSLTAVRRCRKRFEHRSNFVFLHSDHFTGQRADLTLSLDVIYHLVEDEVFSSYMERLFDASERLVLIYSSNVDFRPVLPYVRSRKFTRWVEEHRPQWRLKRHIPNRYPHDERDPHNTSFADFYLYVKN